MIRKFIYLLLLLPCIAMGQDFQFSQYYEHHSLINPALTGTEQDIRAVLDTKSQWKKAAGKSYKTFGTAIDGKVLKGTWEKEKKGQPKKYKTDVGRIGAGMSVYRDKAGDAGLSQLQLNGSVAAFLPVSKFSFLSCGVQAGWQWRRQEIVDLIYPNQYRPGGYDISTYNGETLPADKYRFFDLSTGFMWAYGYSQKGFLYSKQMKARIGAAAYHLTTPKLRTLGNAAEDLKMKYVLHGDMLFNYKKTDIGINPNFVVQMQGKQLTAMAGVLVKYYLQHSQAHYTKFVKNTSVCGGLSYRTNDAISLTCLYESEEKYAVGLSYDLNINGLRKANHLRGGPELMIRFTPSDYNSGPARD